MSEPPAGIAAGSFPRWRAFPPLALGVVMATLDVSVVNIALPTLSRAFGAPLTRIEWVVLGYGLALTGLLLTFGRLADRVGRRRFYGIGLAVFILASALCGAAGSATMLVLARVLQGCGAAMLSATGSALLVASFPESERGRALGAFGAMVGVGLAVGTPLGGIVVAHASWRWLFFINLPIGALALLWLRSALPPDTGSTAAPPPDLAAAAAWTAALTALWLALSRGPEAGWSAPPVLMLFVATLVMLVVFLALERRGPSPLLPIAILRGPLGAAVALTLVSQAISVAVAFHLPLYLEGVLAFGPDASGRWMATLPGVVLLTAPLAGQWSDRAGPRAPAVTGLALATLGLAVLATLGTRLEGVRLLGGMALVGIGLGLFSVPNASALLALVPPEQLGFATGLQATMRNLGLASGAAVMAAMVASIYAARAGARLPAMGTPLLDRAALAAATRTAYAVLAGVAALAALAAARVHSASGRGRRAPAGADSGS